MLALQHRPRSALWAPATWGYNAVILARNACYDHGWLTAAVPARPTISVGGLEAGGSGKTPVTAWVLARLQALGHSPGLLTRGYGRATRGLQVRLSGAPAPASIYGDEPAMMVADGFTGPLAACAQRARGALALAPHCNCFVMDDGFAHRALGRQLNIVVLRAEAPFGGGHLLPRGNLREPPRGLRRADVVWLHAKQSHQGVKTSWWNRLCADALRVVSQARTTTPVDAQGTPVPLSQARVVAATGIAWPQQFFSSVRACAAELMHCVTYADHHPFHGSDVEYLHGLKERCGADAVVVTPKDAVKLASLWHDLDTLWVLGTEIIILQGEAAFLDRLKVTVEQ